VHRLRDVREKTVTFSLFLNFMVIDYPVPTSRSPGKGLSVH
jgi:hypothetical protein